jgi:hypothetical protein
MIPVTKEQHIEPYDTSTLLLSRKLFFFRRMFMDDGSKYNAEQRLFSYSFNSTDSQSKEQRLYRDTEFESLVIEEFD